MAGLSWRPWRGRLLTRTSNLLRKKPKSALIQVALVAWQPGSLSPAPGALHLRPAQVRSPRGCSGPCVPACCCADSQGRPRVGRGSEGGTGVPGRARAHADGVGQAAGSALPDCVPSAAPSTAPGRDHTPYVWASETVWGDSFIDGSSFGYTGETYHYYFLSESLAHGSRIS